MTGCRLIVIGASWGGLRAVSEILAGLPAGFGITVLIVQHRAEDAGDLLAGLLDRAGPNASAAVSSATSIDGRLKRTWASVESAKWSGSTST